MPDLNPTDADILTILADGRRQTQSNLAVLLDKDTGYISTRLSSLRNNSLVHRVGPAKQSTLYEITPTGRAALHDSNTPRPEEVTRSQPAIPHLSPRAFDILDTLHDTDPVPIVDLANTLEINPKFLEYLLDGLAYQYLIEEIDLTVTMTHDNVAIKETTQRAYRITERGHRVATHREDWERGGDPELIEARHG